MSRRRWPYYQKKHYKFHVDLTLNELTEVSLRKAVLFAKVCQLDGSKFQKTPTREEMLANSPTGVLDPGRKEELVGGQ